MWVSGSIQRAVLQAISHMSKRPGARLRNNCDLSDWFKSLQFPTLYDTLFVLRLQQPNLASFVVHLIPFLPLLDDGTICLLTKRVKIFSD